MRIARTSVIHFVSELIATVIGFVAMVYFARKLGAETLGLYFLVVAIYTWSTLLATMLLRQSVIKRISEGVRENHRFTAALIIQFVVLAVLVGLIILSSRPLQVYIGVDVVGALVALTIGGTAFTFARSVLKGEKKVQIAAILKPVERLARSTFQILTIFSGFALLGLLYGHVLALLVASVLTFFFISSRLKIPEYDDFQNIFSFAKYSWLGSLTTRTFNGMDTIVLGFFVSTSLIGIYEIAWNVASVLAIFGSSISQAVFPEISYLSADDRNKEATSILSDALAFTGLFTIPGFVGALILGEYVLSIYGTDFTQGYLILIILVVARLFAAYQWQFVNALSAFDRPDLAFRINLIFIVTNMTLNIALVATFGWIGAAVATAFSAGLTLGLGYVSMQSFIDVEFPYVEIGRQVAAALVMGIVVYFATILVEMSIPIALLLVAAGSCIYFIVLFGISPRFRLTVLRNLPTIGFN